MRSMFIATVSALIALSSLSAGAQPACSLSPVFDLFRQVVGLNIVGDCKEAAAVAENGDITQATNRGLLAYRYADQVVAFTDGETTWLYGPEGVQRRASAERFDWEMTVHTPAPAVFATPAPPPAAPRPTATATAAATRMTPALVARCANLGADEGSAEGSFVVNALCYDAASKYGEAGYLCVEGTARRARRTRVLPGQDQAVADAFFGEIAMYIGSLPR